MVIISWKVALFRKFITRTTRNKKKFVQRISYYSTFSHFFHVIPFFYIFLFINTHTHSNTPIHKKKSFITHTTVQQNNQVVMMTIAQNARHEKYYVFVYNHIITIALSFPIWGFWTNLAHHFYIRVISHTNTYTLTCFVQQKSFTVITHKKHLRYDDNDVYVGWQWKS